MAEVVRSGRFLNVLLGVWIVAAPWLLTGGTAAATWSDVLVGSVIAVLSIFRGTVRERYGSWDRYIV